MSFFKSSLQKSSQLLENLVSTILRHRAGKKTGKNVFINKVQRYLGGGGPDL